MTQSIYEFKIKSLQGKEIDFQDYKNKVILIVNTASKCGYTPQYAGLQSLYLNLLAYILLYSYFTHFLYYVNYYLLKKWLVISPVLKVF